MAKFPKISKLTQKEKEDLFINFCQALASLKNTQEVAAFLKDLLGPAELEMLAKRLEIAKYLIKGESYDEIASQVKVSYGTISRVSFWLKLSGIGYRLVNKRIKKKKKAYSQFEEDIKRLKRVYSRYFWPELLFEKITNELGRRKREKLLSNLVEIEDKGKVMKEFDRHLAEIYKKKAPNLSSSSP